MTTYEKNIPLLQLFYRRCIAKGLRPASIAQYRKVLTRYCKQQNVTETTADDIRDYLARLDVAPATRRVHYMALATFYHYLHKAGHITGCPIDGVERPRVPYKVQRYFSADEVTAMINCWDTTTFTGIRNKTVMTTLLGTGMRRAELAGLTVSDINWQNNNIHVRYAKGGKERLIPMTAELRRILSTYLQSRERYLKHQTPALWVSTVTGEALTPAGVWAIFKRSPLTGERISPHTFRHTFARAWILNGGSITELQVLMGHSDIAITRRYIALAGGDIATVNDKYNPLANTTWKFF